MLVHTKHSKARCQQRALRERDIAMIYEFGTACRDDSVVMKNKDVDREIADRMREIQALERLRGCKIIIKDEAVITAYKATRKQIRVDLRAWH